MMSCVNGAGALEGLIGMCDKLMYRATFSWLLNLNLDGYFTLNRFQLSFS